MKDTTNNGFGGVAQRTCARGCESRTWAEASSTLAASANCVNLLGALVAICVGAMGIATLLLAASIVAGRPLI